jgi:hypothetical protein
VAARPTASSQNLALLEAAQAGANRQPAVALYLDGEAHAVMALALRGDSIAALTRFGDPDLFPRFGLPPISSDLSASLSRGQTP